MSSTDQLPNDGRIQFATGQSSLGPVLVARSARGACAIFMSRVVSIPSSVRGVSKKTSILQYY